MDGCGQEESWEDSKELLDAILSDRSIARLYWALSKMDPETRNYFSAVLELGAGSLRRRLDFYGSHICIRRGRVLLPGGSEAESAWEDLAGASPGSPADFIPNCFRKTRVGWRLIMTCFPRESQDKRNISSKHTGCSGFMVRCQLQLHPQVPQPGVFRPAPWLFLLVSQIQWDPRASHWFPGISKCGGKFFLAGKMLLVRIRERESTPDQECR